MANAHYGFGWYLKEADKAITRYVERPLKEKGLTHFHWQVLNRTHMDGISIKENLYARHYVSPAQLDEILDSMVKRDGYYGVEPIDSSS
ncbi:hypothetical protein [Desmospora activa]|uniref:Uncharacterized protein n=1 Tax=Desmospora activa DSM 45169 TaxID=1121389 RepID=A0A2T4ZA28_9BACL|nr:hypothetical protein [Desmospora activa]PTM58715.1 hypothetical protein C8J48_1303 [Desmospora activa DSM 45169]